MMNQILPMTLSSVVSMSCHQAVHTYLHTYVLGVSLVLAQRVS